MERIKRRVHEILAIPSAPGDTMGRAFDLVIITLIVLNTAAVIIETVDGALGEYALWIDVFEWVSVVVFAVEYLLRIWSVTVETQYAHPVRGRLRWMGTPFAIIDLISILPALLPALGIDLRFLRVLRVLRVLKIGRYSESLRILTDVMRRSRRELTTSLFLVALALLLTASFMYYAEREAQPAEFESIPHAMWWSIVALTTTGYGDIVPVTTAGKVLGGLTALLGVASIALPVGILSSSFVQELDARKQKAAKAGVAAHDQCPHCGKDIKQERVP